MQTLEDKNLAYAVCGKIPSYSLNIMFGDLFIGYHKSFEILCTCTYHISLAIFSKLLL